MTELPTTVMKPLSARLAAVVKRARTQRRIPFTEIAQMLADAGQPIPVIGLRRIETGERRVDLDEAVALAAVLGFNLRTTLAIDIPAQCQTCDDSPPAGFTCNACGLDAV